MNPAENAPLWLTLTVSLLPVLLGCVFLAVAFVSFVHWVDRRSAADRFAAEHISECADVAAIEAVLPDMRDRRASS